MTDGSPPLSDLLALQHLDTAIDQLHYQRANLAERRTLAVVRDEQAAIGRALADVTSQRASLGDRQTALERTLRDLDARSADLSAKLPRTMVVREAEALMAEQRSVQQRRSDVEDEELALLEEDDALEQQEREQRARLEEVDASAATAGEALTAAEAVIDGELAGLGERRAAAAAAIAPAVLARYDDLRRRLGGVAVAELHDGRCSGCHLRLSNVALERVKNAPPGELVECEECGRLLVR